MRPLPGALVKIRLHPNVEGPNDDTAKKDVLVRDARTKEREFLLVGTPALVIGYLEDPGWEPNVYIFVADKGFYRTKPVYLEVLWSPSIE